MFIEENKDHFSVTELVKLTGVSRSGYYYWKKTKPMRPTREELDRPLLERMQELYRLHGGTLGNRRYKQALFDEFGLTVNLKRIDRMRRTYNLPLKTQIKAYRLNPHEHKTVGNLLNRHFNAIKPGIKFVMDITYIRASKQSKFMYLCAIKDLYNGEIVASRMADHQRVELVLETLDELKKNGYKEDALIHTDQGTQFTNGVYLNRLNEMYAFSTPRTKEQLIEAVHDYIHYYNYIRIQLKLKTSPVSYRLRNAGKDMKIVTKKRESAA